MADFIPDAFAIRTTDKLGQSHGGFQWPLEIGAIVTCPDWSARAECGNGLHGLADGVGDYGLLSGDPDAIWWVVGFVRAESVDLGGDKVKFPRCRVEYLGGMGGALTRISQEWIRLAIAAGNGAHADRDHASAAGHSGHASAAGYRGHASAAGDRGHASAAGHSGHASAAGDRGHASAAGDRGHASAAGYSGHASAAGDRGHASAAGYRGHASAVGHRGHASAAGDRGHASAAGHSGHASAAGDRGHASAAGYSGHASAAGHSGHAEVSGRHSIAASLGYAGAARAGSTGAIMLAAWNDGGDLVTVRAAMVGQDGIEPNTWYRLGLDGQFIKLADQ